MAVRVPRSWLQQTGVKPARVRPPIVVTNKRDRGAFGIDSEARREAARVELFLPMPPSANALYANGGDDGGRIKTKAYDDWLSEAGWRVQEQHPARIAGRYCIEIQIPRPHNQSRLDLGNREKAISDLLVRQRIVADDHLAERITQSWGPVGSPVRVVMTKWEASAQ
jgi:crossover junction endodeoxyribonuclease RusA